MKTVAKSVAKRAATRIAANSESQQTAGIGTAKIGTTFKVK
jgi:hypothetical protein